MNKPLPVTSKELIEELDKAFPLTNPSPDDDLITIQRRAGKRELINMLLLRLDRDKTESITGG